MRKPEDISMRDLACNLTNVANHEKDIGNLKRRVARLEREAYVRADQEAENPRNKPCVFVDGPLSGEKKACQYGDMYEAVQALRPALEQMCDLSAPPPVVRRFVYRRLRGLTNDWMVPESWFVGSTMTGVVDKLARKFQEALVIKKRVYEVGPRGY